MQLFVLIKNPEFLEPTILPILFFGRLSFDRPMRNNSRSDADEIDFKSKFSDVTVQVCFRATGDNIVLL